MNFDLLVLIYEKKLRVRDHRCSATVHGSHRLTFLLRSEM